MALIAAGIAAAAGLGSAYMGASASSSAAKSARRAQEEAAARLAAASGVAANEVRAGTADAVSAAQDGTTQALGYLEPYRTGGAADYSALRNAVGTTFQESPGYQFALDQGVNAIDHAAGARGMLNSGSRLRELTRFGTGLANQEYNNWRSSLSQLAQMGVGAATGSAGIAQQGGNTAAALAAQGANNAANITMQGAGASAPYTAGAGQAQAAGTVGQANSIMGGINQGIGLYSLMNGFGGMGSVGQKYPTAGPGMTGSNGMLGGGV